MTILHQTLIDRFGEENVQATSSPNNKIPFLLVNIDLGSSVTLLMTDGLSDYKMPVPEKYIGYEHNELYFCLPSYWNWDDINDENANWIFTWLEKMASFVVEKETWFGTGHTIPNGKEKKGISERMKQNHFLLSHPILLSKELEPIALEDKTIHFLSIIPIFQDEMNYKEAKGTFKIIEQFITVGVSEKVDDFRSSVFGSKWNLLRKLTKIGKR